jgi:hypothetical protein
VDGMAKAPGAGAVCACSTDAFGFWVTLAAVVRIESHVARVDLTSPEGNRAVVVAARVSRIDARRRQTVRGRCPRPDEEDDPARVADEKPRQEEPVERTDGHRGLGAYGLSHLVDPLVDAGCDARCRPFHERQERVADGLGQPSLEGHRASEIVATMAPAMAAATPLRKGSDERMREKKDGELRSDMME